MPFALLYSRPGDGETTTLVTSTGLASDCPLLATWTRDQGHSCWPLAEAHCLQKPLLVSDLAERFGNLTIGYWPEPVSQAVILPATVAGQNGLELSLVLGVNPRKGFDAEYQRFFDAVVAHVGSILGSARAHEQVEIVLTSITDGFAVLDKRWRYTYFSDQAVEITGMKSEDLIGKCVWDVFPEAKGTQFYECYHRAPVKSSSWLTTIRDSPNRFASVIHSRWFEPINSAPASINRPGIKSVEVCTRPPILSRASNMVT